MSPRVRIIALSGFAVALAIAAAALMRVSEPPLESVDLSAVPQGPARRTAELLVEAAQHIVLSPRPEPRAYVALREGGLRVADGWFAGPDWRKATITGVDRLARAPGAQSADTVEVCLPYDPRSVRLRSKRGALGNVHRGVRGLTLSLDNKRQSFCPTQMIAENRDFARVEELFRERHELSGEQYVERVKGEQFDAHQLLVSLADGRVTRMHRGNTVVPMSEVDHDHTQALAQGMGDWLVRQVHADGRMTYMYFPSRGEEPEGLNNMIRQYMASIALVRLGKQRKDATIAQLAAKNLRYNFAHFYRQDGELGLITWRNKSKLGAAALAALAVVEAPFRADFAAYETSLLRLVEHMQRPDGSFQTFYGSNRDDNQNFYPGEALLLWSTLLEDKTDPALLERFMRAFRHYRQWHRANRNPAFIPWHTQAYFKVWKLTHDEELAQFIFEMNDFLSDFQEYDDSRYEDTRGRFYDPDRANFGPPHASSTGVYLEGLIDAYELAKKLSDAERAERYRTTIRRGLRSLMQLQFQDDVDMFYVSKRLRVLGGLRTTVYDNRVRVDNVQHSLMALMKIIPTFDRDRAW